MDILQKGVIMKVVVINGSPCPEGYTMRMVKIFEEHLKKIGKDINMEYIHLIDEDLRDCLGCCRCLAYGGHTCPLKDAAPRILEKMEEADAIIFAAPGYAQMVPGIYKNFMDRFMYLDHINDTDIIGKTAIVISTSGGEMVNRPAKYMANMGVIWWGCNLTDILGFASAFFMASEKYRRKTIKRLKKAAERFYTSMQREQPRRPSLRQYLYFLYNKAEILTIGDGMPGRYKVWTENNWMKAGYYYKTFMNPLYQIISAPVFALLRFVHKTMMNGEIKEKMLEYGRWRIAVTDHARSDNQEVM
jgi:multimeric flavodoxin WrbA